MGEVAFYLFQEKTWKHKYYLDLHQRKKSA